MNILVVSSYPPVNCGIGKYAEQQVASLRDGGRRVDVLSPADGGGDFHENLLGGLRPLRLLKYAWAYDEVSIHYAPHFFYDPLGRFNRILTSLALVIVALIAGRRISWIVHESGFDIDNAREEGRGPLRHRIDRWYWRMARRVIFHTVLERDLFAEFYRLKPDRKAFEVWPHEQFFKRRCAMDRVEARRALGVEPDATILLCIGFIQPHKGFDRAIEALQNVDAPDLRLKVVGAVRLWWDKAHAYADRLHELADADPRCEILEGYLSDELFDIWIVAADYLVIPYTTIWTSGVAARARLYDRPVIATRTGGLAEQIDANSFLFSNDDELTAIFNNIARR